MLRGDFFFLIVRRHPKSTQGRSSAASDGYKRQTWADCDDARRKDLVSMWKETWNWKKTVDELLQDASGSSPPWQVPRLIGHRGSGKTSRPVIGQ